MSAKIILTNATLVLRDEVVSGTVSIRGGHIEAVQPGRAAAPGAADLDGDYLLPGIVDLHTDNLERQVQPRSMARWPSRSALMAHDAQCAAAGITTVLDALCLGDLGFDEGRVRTFHEAVADLDQIGATGLLKAAHYLHLRCELPATDMPALLDGIAGHPLVRLASLMDHCPGFGQYADLGRFRALKRRETITDADIDRFIARTQEQRARLRGPHRRLVLDRLGGAGVPLASHDDRTEAEVAANAADGIRISEFPVTLEAARAARAHDLQVIGGAPNLVRGGSHAGNVAASELLDAGAVDAFASDYVPVSLVEAAFIAGRSVGLPEAVAMVTDRPARMARLHDRGRLEPGLLADLVRVRMHAGLPVVRQVWRGGERVI